MKKIIQFTILLIVLSACAAPPAKVPESAATDMPPASLPNPASVYCIKQGNQLEIRTAADGSQYGICVFRDGSTCDEWAFYRGECGLKSQKRLTPAVTVDGILEASGGDTGGNNPGSLLPTEDVVDWWGIIKSMEAGAQ